MSKKWWVAGVVLVVGATWSVKDYREWKVEETKNYGHGPVLNQAPAVELSQRYMNEYAGFRMRYPAGWSLIQTLKTGRDKKFDPPGLTQVVKITDGKGVVEVTVSVDDFGGDVVRVLESEVEKLGGEGIRLTREREYWHTEREDWGVLTWRDGGNLVKRAWAVDGKRTVVVRGKCLETEEDKYVKTLDEMIKAVTIL